MKLSGVFVRIDKAGYVFCRGANFQKMKEVSQLFPEKFSSLGLGITVIAEVRNKPAFLLMRAIHNLNDAENIPGIFKYLESQKLAA
jgi:hypothetical protein